MKLSIEPHFDTQTIECMQNLEVICVEDLLEPKIELDCAQLNITKILYSEIKSKQDIYELGFIVSNEKLIIKLPKILKKDTVFFLKIEYYAKPKRGFHFINSVKTDNALQTKQAWTQGEMIESKYWFPCFDDPRIKYSKEISVTVPNNFIVVSNGDHDSAVETFDNKKIYKWKENYPMPSYLASIVTGNFFESCELYQNNSEIKLLYYVPHDKKDRLERTFESTSDTMKFFESYFNFSYPYSKYAQTAVKNFDYGGMENTSCTTLEEEILLDEKAAIDDTIINHMNSSKTIIAHELAHQWFGDLVTCKDWSNIWLNEGFATYCEALYVEYFTYGDEKSEFYRYMLLLADNYFSEACDDYERPVVTDVYKYPDELFDSHSYKKGAWILHMIRNIVHEENFKKGLKKYLDIFQYQNTTTDDFRKIMEEVSGINLESFFKQWIYTKGHPELVVTFDKSNKIIKVLQKEDNLFDFEIEIKIALSDGSISFIPFHVVKEKENTLEITKMIKNIQDKDIEWFSIDPNVKILKKIDPISYDPKDLSMIFNLIDNGQTIAEKLQGIDSLDKKIISNENCAKIIEFLKTVILDNKFYYVSAIAALKLGEIGTFDNIDKLLKNTSFQTLVECINQLRNISKTGITKIRVNLINAIGSYIPEYDYWNELKDIIEIGDNSYYVEGAAIQTISKYKDVKTFELLNKVINRKNTYNDTIPRAAIRALRNFKNTNDDDLRQKEIKVLAEKITFENSNFVRTNSVSALGDFLVNDDKKTINTEIFLKLLSSLDDEYSQVRKVCCAVFETNLQPSEHQIDRNHLNQLFEKLEQIIDNDLLYDVRRSAELCLFAIRERHYSKVKETMKNEQDFDNYVKIKKQIRTRNIFGYNIWR